MLCNLENLTRTVKRLIAFSLCMCQCRSTYGCIGSSSLRVDKISNNFYLCTIAELATSRMSSGHDLFNYTPAEDLGGSQMLKETQVLGSAYDRYLQSSVILTVE